MRTRQSDSLGSSDEENCEIHNNSWLPRKIKQGREVVGVTISECEGGWDGVIHLAQDRDCQNRVVIDVENKIGRRELSNMPCSIIYERSRKQ